MGSRYSCDATRYNQAGWEFSARTESQGWEWNVQAEDGCFGAWNECPLPNDHACWIPQQAESNMPDYLPASGRQQDSHMPEYMPAIQHVTPVSKPGVVALPPGVEVAVDSKPPPLSPGAPNSPGSIGVLSP